LWGQRTAARRLRPRLLIGLLVMLLVTYKAIPMFHSYFMIFNYAK